MQDTSKAPSETPVATMPQHLVDRFENEWRQMRSGISEPSKSPFSASDKR